MFSRWTFLLQDALETSLLSSCCSSNGCLACKQAHCAHIWSDKIHSHRRSTSPSVTAKSEQVSVYETYTHERDGRLQTGIDEAANEDHAENYGCMVSDLSRQVARRKRRKKRSDEQEKAKYAGPQKSLDKRIVDAG